MRTGRNSVQAGALLACVLLFTAGAAPGEAEEVFEDREPLPRQQCRVDEPEPWLRVHRWGRHPYNPHHSSPPFPPYPPLVYPPSSPYYAPYPASAICRNRLRFCYLTGALLVGSPCVCPAPLGGVWFSGWVTVY